MEKIGEEIGFEVEGVAPLKMDRWHGLLDPKTPEGYKKQAKEKCYRNEKGDLAVPANAVKASMRLASTELGKKMDGKKNRQAISAGVFISPMMLSLKKKAYDSMMEDVVTRKGTGDKVTRVMSYRPLINKWKCSGTMRLVGVPLGFAKQALELAGIKYGLLGHRPEFGRFVITKWSEKNEGK